MYMYIYICIDKLIPARMLALSKFNGLYEKNSNRLSTCTYITLYKMLYS